jgi:hypothetical protein
MVQAPPLEFSFSLRNSGDQEDDADILLMQSCQVNPTTAPPPLAFLCVLENAQFPEICRFSDDGTKQSVSSVCKQLSV